jgi:hypothetical protein
MLKVTFEFKTPEEAITAIAKIAGLGQAAPAPRIEIRKPSDIEGESRREPEPTKAERGPRADKGKKRGPYKGRETNVAGETLGKAAQPDSLVGAGTPFDSVSRPDAEASPPAAPETAAQPASEQTGAGTPESTSAMSGAVAAVPTEGDIQKALEKVFAAKQASGAMALLDKFGVKRGRDLPVEHRAQFIQAAEEACK